MDVDDPRFDQSAFLGHRDFSTARCFSCNQLGHVQSTCLNTNPPTGNGTSAPAVTPAGTPVKPSKRIGPITRMPLLVRRSTGVLAFLWLMALHLLWRNGVANVVSGTGLTLLPNIAVEVTLQLPGMSISMLLAYVSTTDSQLPAYSICCYRSRFT